MSLFKSLAIVGATLLPTASSADWSGYYLGASVGNVTEGELEYNTGLVQEIEEAMPFGFFIGYQSQNGRLVFGGEFAYAAAEDIELENAIVDVAYGEGDLKARLGYDFGNVLAMASLAALLLRLLPPLKTLLRQALDLALVQTLRSVTTSLWALSSCSAISMANTKSMTWSSMTMLISERTPSTFAPA